MGTVLEEARRRIGDDPQLAGFTVNQEGEELHLARQDEVFARLIPAGAGRWHLEHFQNRKKWERLDFEGTLGQCLEFLADSPHFLFWRG